MSVEAKRGCGFRKVGGLYMVGGGVGIPCDRLPFTLTVCACCGQGIKQAMGWTWINVAKFFQGPHLVPSASLFNETATGALAVPCGCMHGYCPLCSAPETLGRAGLVWIGEKFYKMPSDFIKEGIQMGFSRRIKAVPHGFKLGETYIMLAHSKAIQTIQPHKPLAEGEIGITDPVMVYTPGIFYAWLPQRLEKIMKESTRGTEEIADLEKRGITPVFVPDNDPDHQGNVHDDFDRNKKEEKS